MNQEIEKTVRANFFKHYLNPLIGDVSSISDENYYVQITESNLEVIAYIFNQGKSDENDIAYERSRIGEFVYIEINQKPLGNRTVQVLAPIIEDAFKMDSINTVFYEDRSSFSENIEEWQSEIKDQDTMSEYKGHLAVVVGLSIIDHLEDKYKSHKTRSLSGG
jgi:hypothetical protein